MDATLTRLAAVQARIAAAARRAGRRREEIELVAVSKSHPAEAIRAAWEAGQLVFGESRVQEALQKAPFLPGSIRWHFIGHLQRNKVRKALPIFELIHSIDSLDTARVVDRVAADEGLFPRVLLEVNLASEGTKFGFSPARLRGDLDALLELRRLQIEGLMIIPPFAEDSEAMRPHFNALRALRDQIEGEAGVSLPTLSMGMSGDFEVAIEEGATLVRVGTAIFGERPKGPR